MEKYKILKDGYIQRQSDLALIPPTEKNKDYLNYLEDVKNGSEVENFDYKAEEERQKVAKEKIDKEHKKENLIQKKIRELAIESLKEDGVLDSKGELIDD